MEVLAVALQAVWVSAVEGKKFAHVIPEVEGLRQKVAVEEIGHTVEILTAKDSLKRQQAVALAST